MFSEKDELNITTLKSENATSTGFLESHIDEPAGKATVGFHSSQLHNCKLNISCAFLDVDNHCCNYGLCCFEKSNPIGEIETSISKVTNCYKCYGANILTCCPEEFCCLSNQSIVGAFSGVSILVEIAVILMVLFFLFCAYNHATCLEYLVKRIREWRKERKRQMIGERERMEMEGKTISRGETEDSDTLPTLLSYGEVGEDLHHNLGTYINPVSSFHSSHDLVIDSNRELRRASNSDSESKSRTSE